MITKRVSWYMLATNVENKDHFLHAIVGLQS